MHISEKWQRLEVGEMDLKLKGLGWIPAMKFMWLWGTIIPLNYPEVVSSYTEGKLYLKGKM